MRVVVALGGNALLKRGQPPTFENQRRNVQTAAEALAPIANEHELVITHGNGPQVGLLALQGAVDGNDEPYPLDALDAETEGQIGYLVEQELRNVLPPGRSCVTLLTQIEVDPADAAFKDPSKPIGPFYRELEARVLERDRDWRFVKIGHKYRRVVPSPQPIRILEQDVIDMLIEKNVIVICAGGGGIPIIRLKGGNLVGVEAVIDKDLASALLARKINADALIMLTDVDGVYERWGEPEARLMRRLPGNTASEYTFAPGSMEPKVKAACDFADAAGGIAGIGKLEDAAAILAGKAGTLITSEPEK